MNNAIFILTDVPIEISRLHVCTWDLHGDGLIEIGVEFGSDDWWQKNKQASKLGFIMSLPFVRAEDKVLCLAHTLVGENNANSKFVFNDTVTTTHTIKDEPANGSILEFRQRDPLAILPIYDIKREDGQLSFSVNNLDILGDKICQGEISAYIRLLIMTKLENFVLKHSGIAKTSYLYDMKINEMRNLPNQINQYLNNGKYICKTISSCFCMHVIPSDYHVSYADSNKLKNTRILESQAFNRYLPQIKSSDNEYLILFQKDKREHDQTQKSIVSDSYSFFTEFEKERIGNEQIIISIGVNLFCSLLIGIGMLNNQVRTDSWYNRWEVWGFVIAFGSLFLYLVIPWSQIWHRVKRWWKR